MRSSTGRAVAIGILYVREGGAAGAWRAITGVGTNPGLTQPQADGLYVNVTGDTMTGPLTISGQPKFNLNTTGAPWIVDTANDEFRIYRNGYLAIWTTPSGTQVGLGQATKAGVHPVYGGSAIWPWGRDGGGQYGLLQIATETYINAEATGYLRIGNSDVLTWNSTTVSLHRQTWANAELVCQAQVTIGASNQIVWSQWGGGWRMEDGIWIRSVNSKSVWLATGHYGTNGSLFIGYGGLGDGGFHIDVTNAKACRLSGGVQSPWYRGNSGDSDTYIDFPADGVIRHVNNGQDAFSVRSDAITTNQRPIRLYGIDDGNHGIKFLSSLNGVEIDGYAKVRIFQVAQGMIYDFEWNGYGYAPAGWVASSSLKLKENIEDLSAEQAIDIVSNLRPVTYDRIDGVGTDQIGFVAEWTDPVAPHAVAREQDGTPKGIDYGKFTPVLTKVMQTVLDRLDALEANQ